MIEISEAEREQITLEVAEASHVYQLMFLAFASATYGWPEGNEGHELLETHATWLRENTDGTRSGKPNDTDDEGLE